MRGWLVILVCGLIIGCSSETSADSSRAIRRDGTAAAEKPADRRIALVIGNFEYRNIPPLKNPGHDAQDMAERLKQKGFEVTLHANAGREKMENSIRDFGRSLQQGGIGLFFYAGHGMQVNGINYLIPTDADIQAEDEVRHRAVDAGLILDKMQTAANSLNIVILDACRDNPFARSFRSASRGLAHMDAPSGSLIIYATSPGKVADDGTGRNGVFTKYFLEKMDTPGLEIREMLSEVRVAVEQETRGRQTPWELSSLRGRFFFTPEAAPAAGTMPQAGPVVPDAQPDTEAEAWKYVKDSSRPQDLKHFLELFPGGKFAPVARLRLKQLEDAQEAAKVSLGSNSDAATSANPEVQNAFRTGERYYQDKAYDRAVQPFLVAAEKGHAQSQFYLGLMYEESKGVKGDYAEAAKWYRRAAEQGNADGQINLGIMYENGKGIKPDYAEAVNWYRKAAEQGSAHGQCNLGFMYENGKGVRQDYAEAVNWYRKAAEQGHARGQYNLGILYEDGRGVKQDYGEAVRWYRKAAEQGYANGLINLGLMYETGKGGTQDYAQAVSWYRKAAEEGSAHGQCNLGFMYETGKGVKQDYAQAVSWYRKAADQGLARGQYNLAVLYDTGKGIKQDYGEAVNWYRRAAEQGYASAQSNLGFMYETGRGVRQDYAQAVAWYRQAAEQGNEDARNALKRLPK